jgi:predicted DNA-binding protein
MRKKAKTTRLTDQPMSIRIPADLRERIDALTRRFGTQSAVLRLALLEGVKVLERRYGGKP